MFAARHTSPVGNALVGALGYNTVEATSGENIAEIPDIWGDTPEAHIATGMGNNRGFVAIGIDLP